jgi:hypothetical protein
VAEQVLTTLCIRMGDVYNNETLVERSLYIVDAGTRQLLQTLSSQSPRSVNKSV